MVERKSSISVNRFKACRAASTPIHLHGSMESWDAMRLWTDEYLTGRFGEENVEVMAWRESDPLYEINCEQHRSNMRFADYIKTVSRGMSNDFYITANNHFFRRKSAQVLLDDIGEFPYVAEPRNGDNTFLWFGAAGTITPLHYDKVDLILTQIRGNKIVTLIPPAETPFVYNSVGVFGDVDCSAPDFEKYPLYRKARPQLVFLEPWEALFIPQGWWHHVRASTTSISVSFTNLV